MSWSDGYVTEIDYTLGYYRELSPMMQGLALLNRGLRSPTFGPGLKYLELGFGQGLSINVHAATMEGEFWGTDFNPAHALSAQEMAIASGSNAKLFDNSFAELAARPDLPEFDIISLHGIWSWISKENRAAIVELIRRRLKPGGVVYVSYNSMPGWAPATPLRELLKVHLDLSANPAMPMKQKVDEALKFAKGLLDANATYFVANPQIKERLTRLESMDASYLAHEYLNDSWQPTHFHEVSKDLDEAKLSFAGSASVLDHIDQLNFTDKGRELMANVQHTVIRETIRDYLVNQQFRRDLWVRGARRLTTAERNVALRTGLFVLTRRPDTVALEVRGGLGTAKMQESLYKPVIEAMAAANGAVSLQELEAKVAPKGINTAQLLQCILVLVGSGQAGPAQPPKTVAAVAKKCQALNRLLCQAAGDSGAYLASPVLGTAIGVGTIQKAFLLSRMSGKKQPEQWANDAWQLLQSQGQRLVKDGKPIESPEANLKEAQAQAKDFADQQLPTLVRLGVA